MFVSPFRIYFDYTSNQVSNKAIVGESVMESVMENSTLSEVLKRIAHERQLSLRRFAETVGISHSYISKLMSGVDSRSKKPTHPSIDVVLRIADALEVPRIEFLRQCGYLDESQ